MKRLCAFVILVVSLMLIISHITIFAFNLAVNYSTHPLASLLKKRNVSADAIFFGDSTLFRAINLPLLETYGFVGMNLASPGQPPEFTNLLISDTRLSEKSIAFVSATLGVHSIDDSKIKYFSPLGYRWNIKPLTQLLETLLPTLGLSSTLSIEFIRYIFTEYNTANLLPTKTSPPNPNLQHTQSFFQSAYDKRDSLDKATEICRDKFRTCYVVLIPPHPEAAVAGAYAEFRAILKQNYRSCLIDLTTVLDQPHHFFDSIHMSERGAHSFTKNLVPYLRHGNRNEHLCEKI